MRALLRLHTAPPLLCGAALPAHCSSAWCDADDFLLLPLANVFTSFNGVYAWDARRPTLNEMRPTPHLQASIFSPKPVSCLARPDPRDGGVEQGEYPLQAANFGFLLSDFYQRQLDLAGHSLRAWALHMLLSVCECLRVGARCATTLGAEAPSTLACPQACFGV